MSSTNDQRLKIFLSHSGLDADRSISLQRDLEERFKNLDYRVKVFNTSTVEDRFKELVLSPGGEWSERTKQYEIELRKYIEQNLLDSIAYLLLATPTSLAANSHWIRFEIDTAKSTSRRSVSICIGNFAVDCYVRPDR